MEQVQIASAKAHFSALLARVEAGEEIEIARRGKTIARLVPAAESGRNAAEALREAWELGGFDLEAPEELPMDKKVINLD